MHDRRVAVVVEDDEDIRGLVVALLGQSGFEVHEAATGSAGVELVREHEPVLVTVDLGLPDIDGYEVTRRVRLMTDAYVVMLTARAEEIDTLIGLDAGADDYLTKPFRPRELRARIEAMLRRPRAGREPVAAGVPGPGGGTTPAGADPAPGWAPAVVEGSGVTDRTAVAEVPAGSGAAENGAAANGAAGSEHRMSLDGLELFPDLHHVVADGREVSLTPTEFLLLETLLAGGRVVRSKAELSRIIRGDEPDAGTFVALADERTVEVHLGNLRRKLQDDPKSPRWVQTVRGVGYRMTGAASVDR